ncbi:GNAT family N-acetyltransferase [Denitrobaculum tricleocarpae]|uniref:GNAT family N-acetyltransferase n=1 Tax=Denitrobaculum tricleocarpae TaxID=2591009 RepID=A0A545U2V7_9PROT|nr:GNAT family N-acetyltransferase [Denitrobaculum tricleocarpae]TQV83817.1 GNAT family N-acetyltransferase [Denitrobaculum tricleocarpae]
MNTEENQAQITYLPDEMDLERVCDFVMSSYWGLKLDKAQIMGSFAHSSCVALMTGDTQIAFARAVSDRTTCAHIKDFFVFDGFRGKGYGTHLLTGLLKHPDLLAVPQWYLGTKNAHAFYRRHGFKPSPEGIYMYRHLARTV